MRACDAKSSKSTRLAAAHPPGRQTPAKGQVVHLSDETRSDPNMAVCRGARPSHEGLDEGLLTHPPNICSFAPLREKRSMRLCLSPLVRSRHVQCWRRVKDELVL